MRFKVRSSKMAVKMSGPTDKMFGPLTFEKASKFEDTSSNVETKCILCEDSFNLSIRLDIFLRHLFDVHRCVVEDIQNIEKLPEYLAYWRDRIKSGSLESIIPSVKIDSTSNKYYLFSTLLKEDKDIRHKLRLEHVLEVQEFERNDKSFSKQCLFCRLNIEGTRINFLDHLTTSHNLQLGNPQNLVYMEDLINHIEQKLENLNCIYCEKTFPERNILKEHMRKKLHKRINPANQEYDKYYIVNYLESGKSWKKLEKEVDHYALELGENSDNEYSDWNEKEDQITCLFCSRVETKINNLFLHMDSEHNFDWVESTQNLDFYQKVKLVNYLRRQVHLKKCPFCDCLCESFDSLEKHLTEMEHYKVPEDIKVFEQPEFYFPTYENDAFLYQIDDMED